jgi:hypothetical protein
MSENIFRLSERKISPHFQDGGLVPGQTGRLTVGRNMT